MKNRRPHDIAIDRITLPPGTVGTAKVRAAIERELARLVADNPARTGAATPAANVQVKPGADADAIGAAVAREIHRGMSKEGSK